MIVVLLWTMSHVIHDDWKRFLLKAGPMIDRKGISYPPKALRSEVLSIIHVTHRYVVDEMASHMIVRLPVAHYTLKPMGTGQVSHTHEFYLTEVEHLVWEWFKVVTPERWACVLSSMVEIRLRITTGM